MTFIVQIPKKVERKLTHLPNSVIDKILHHLKILSNNPFPQKFKKLHNRDGYRLSVGDYRIIYEVDLAEKGIIILRIAHRQDVYKGK
ncbi:type II toxin-antitoxin system mRNA interferase toxin, RelE/StbE family [bacterium]|nr:type II toxin-antitoxin system mRNA interferase toxin, RelE/StbE family [bacterium]